ncbi:protein Flattop [Tautogolabrus adspersus]
MSSGYSANQYESAFRSQRLQNWCETKRFKERPAAQEGHTTFIADDRGHLLPDLVKGGSAWPDFKGTWDLPARIPARHVNPTGRSEEGLRRLRSWGFDPQHTGRSQTHKSSTTSDTGEQSDNGAHPPSSAVKADGQPTKAAERDGQQSTAAEEKPAVRSAAEEKPAVRSAAEEKPAVRSAAEEKPAVRSASSQRSSSRAHSVTGRTGSYAAQKEVPKRTPSSSRQRHRE